MTLSNKQVIELANQHNMQLVESSLKGNESGLDFQVVFTEEPSGDQWVLRIPRREDVIPRANKEKRILDVVGRHLSVQTPNWSVFTDELIAYKRLTGIPTGTIDPQAKRYDWEIDDKNVPDQFHETLGKAMMELHQINHHEAEEAGMTMNTPVELQPSMKKRMDKVKQEFKIGEPLWGRWQRWLANDSFWPKHTAVIHGDLHPGHILINKQAEVTGLIDWTEGRVDDPANDFVAHLAAFGEEALKQLIAAYQEAGGYVWPNMFAHIVELSAAYPVAIAEFAMISGMGEYKEMAQEALLAN
ncbi:MULTISPECIES: macrolide 2'-phosphotransferase [Virgibacillus]|uniref:Phosphotransferase enzyme family protein n=2 Tax=Virgibacillus TaxID=84406 RepID=A0A024QF89_9BACI|nr:MULTISPECIES: macrolide 2'-phosphotransferase [Virgibacillus]EQB39035.1 hypothetical protein M948_01405 [Virgibacillus sp. CM-4]MYL43394.1 phosphotransferase [Virgibacillus massiliensis]GGJ68501.1 Mph(B) family macrolide 2'-phosphotransferase [Virgibacillus kapii]CDQ41159.1 Phosphotransferase enzyme family protein [Virgibacillus massiliensis]